MKKFITSLVLLCTVLVTSCKKTEHEPEPPVRTDNIVVTQNITTNTTWTNDNVYQLGGRIVVTAGATLTIEPGTIIKGEAGTGANATALIVARGAKIIADGREDAPIIFTSVADEILPEDIESGVFASPNLEPTINGLWGGVIVLGHAPISASNDQGDISQVQIEGIPTSDANGLYGGNNPQDNSGILRYISIRHGGANIGSGNEINGLTLGGVGNGTIIENIEIVANQDDGIEWFGGTVNVSNVVVWNVGDDAIDTDQSWSGTLDNFFIITPQGHCFELDGPEGSLVNGHIIRNGYIIASGDGGVAMDLINTDDNSVVALENLYFMEVVEGQKINRVSHTVGVVSFTNILLNVDAIALPNHVNGNIPTGVNDGTPQTPFVNSEDFQWSWAYQEGNIL
jgi:hypothetical protein